MEVVQFTENGERKVIKPLNEWGDSDTFKLISRENNKSVSAMEIEGVGCVIRTFTEISEALVFVPNVKIEEATEKVYNIDTNREEERVVARRLVKAENHFKI